MVERHAVGLQAQGGDMRGAHDFADAEVDPAGLGLGALNEFLGAGNGAVGADGQIDFLKAEQGDEIETVQRVPGAAGDDVEHEQGIGVDADGVPVRLLAAELHHTDKPGAAGFVDEGKGLADHFLEILFEKAGALLSAASRIEGDDDLDALVRIGSGMGEGRQGKGHENRQQEGKTTLHGEAPLTGLSRTRNGLRPAAVSCSLLNKQKPCQGPPGNRLHDILYVYEFIDNQIIWRVDP